MKETNVVVRYNGVPHAVVQRGEEDAAYAAILRWAGWQALVNTGWKRPSGQFRLIRRGANDYFVAPHNKVGIGFDADEAAVLAENIVGIETDETAAG